MVFTGDSHSREDVLHFCIAWARHFESSFTINTPVHQNTHDQGQWKPPPTGCYYLNNDGGVEIHSGNGLMSVLNWQGLTFRISGGRIDLLKAHSTSWEHTWRDSLAKRELRSSVSEAGIKDCLGMEGSSEFQLCSKLKAESRLSSETTSTATIAAEDIIRVNCREVNPRENVSAITLRSGTVVAPPIPKDKAIQKEKKTVDSGSQKKIDEVQTNPTPSPYDVLAHFSSRTFVQQRGSLPGTRS
ncbi:hypothetical protein F3Y22_tig00111841pilonHSYRG00326 [Hibiscus syriacus]|uniref:Uncharacterized protein n=1 Tax=Hibiscus syriacus TaxID=106335 RepID=A0A6A2YEA9_HIBSY|nr:hypothetical protein F3Y22_tig00111841pilonHSYRG00326 [Hibiscus syriacus]